jgi:hypothetical protein
MSESVKKIIDRESFWCSWKDNKCFNFEKPSSDKIKEKAEKFKKREIK